MLFPKPPFPTAAQEFEACLTVVLRNLRPENWVDLISEAQAQMIQETEVLLYSELLSPDQALQLIHDWQRLQSYLTGEQWNALVHLLRIWHQSQRFKQGAIDRGLIPFLQERSVTLLRAKGEDTATSKKVAS